MKVYELIEQDYSGCSHYGIFITQADAERARESLPISALVDIDEIEVQTYEEWKVGREV